MARKLTWWQAAEIMGLTDRTMRRWRARMEEGGYTSLSDRRKHPSPKRIPLEQAQEMLKLFQEKYSDFNVRHFHEKLASDHGIQLSYTWVKKALQLPGEIHQTRQTPKATAASTDPGDDAAHRRQQAPMDLRPMARF